MTYTVCALYCFVPIDNPSILEESLKDQCIRYNIKGGLIVAHEGINGTVAGPPSSIDSFISFLKSDIRFKNIDIKLSTTDEQPFYRIRVHVKSEIVTLGVEDADPCRATGKYVDPKDWNQIITDPDTIVIDTRNDYEVQIGSFEGARNPCTKIFREFPEYAERELMKDITAESSHEVAAQNHVGDVKKKKKVAMFCTGGIRCEKASAYLLNHGVDEVYQLKGGILNYLEKVPPSDSLWRGECYVFDQRVSVRHGVEPGTYSQCRGCRMPLAPEECQEGAEKYLEGVHCRHCFDSLTEKRREALEQRNRQMALAAMRNTEHLGFKKTKGGRKERQSKRLQTDQREEGSAKAVRVEDSDDAVS